MSSNEKNEPLYVVAPSYQWFLAWCQDSKLDPRDKSAVIYIHGMPQVQGRRLVSEEQIVDLGPFDPKRYELVLALRERVKGR